MNLVGYLFLHDEVQELSILYIFFSCLTLYPSLVHYKKSVLLIHIELLLQQFPPQMGRSFKPMNELEINFRSGLKFLPIWPNSG